MASEQLIERITTNPKVMGGKPVIKGTRIMVETIVKLVASGASTKEIIEDFPISLKRTSGQHCSTLPSCSKAKTSSHLNL